MTISVLSMFSLTGIQRFGVAVLAVTLTAVFRIVLGSILPQDLPLFLFILSIAVACSVGGLGPGLLATGLSLLFLNSPDLTRVLGLGFTGTVFSILFDRARNAIKAVIEGQRYVQNVIDGLPSGVSIYDVRQKKIIFINRAVAAALGSVSGQELPEPGFIRSMMHPDDWQSFVDHVKGFSGLGEGETGEFEFRCYVNSGAWRWFHARDQVFRRNEDGSVREIISTLIDITERKNAEEDARFMTVLDHAIMPLTDAKEIVAVTVRMLGEHMSLDRCGYAEVEADLDHFVMLGDYARGPTQNLTGRYRMSDFGERERNVLLEGQPYVINDIEAESPQDTDISLYLGAKMRALVCVPLNKSGRFVARMAVYQSMPRRWSSLEIKLVKFVANRCWESVERATALRRWTASYDDYRAFIAISSEGIWRFELEQPIPVMLPVDDQIEMLYRFAYLAECNNAMSRMYGYDDANEILGARLGDLLVRSNPKNVEFLRALQRSGYNLNDVETHEVDRNGTTKVILNNLSGIIENGMVVRAWGTQRDITAQKQAEEALRASEERYRLLTDLSPDGVVVADTDGTIHLANPAVLRMLVAEAADVTGRNLFDFIAPEFRELCSAMMKALITKGTPATQEECALRSTDGRIVPVEVSAVRFDGQQHFGQLVMHDLSGRKQAEAERERWAKEIESERDRLRRILEQMPIGVIIAEAPSGRLIFHNIEASRLLHRPFLVAEDYRAYTKYGALREDGLPYPAEAYPAARSLKSGEVVKSEEIKYRLADSTETYFSVNSAPIYDREDRMVLTIVTFIDIGERKRAEVALRESEERFAKAFQTSPDGLVISRIADAVVLEVNDSFVSMFGYARDEIIGESLLQVYVDPASRERALKILKEKNVVRDFELTMKRKSGEVRWILFSAEPMDLRGEHCWLTISRDITERKRIEEEREQALLQEKRAREEAETASRMKDEFLATISHELRTPLTAIVGWASMLTQGLLKEPQTRHALEVIDQSARSQTRLVDDILDTSRIITGRLKLDAHPLQIAWVFQAAIDVIRPSAEAKRISLEEVVDERGGIVFGDANRLQQVIWNLLWNAVKFTKEGGRVEARLSRSDGQIEISVADTGIGIDPQFLPYVFDRFRQADSTTTRRYGGLGLGLAIVRHLVELHGGTVEASSPGQGQGATFKVSFPIASPEVLLQAANRPGAELKQPTGGPRHVENANLDGVRVLVVEDDPYTLEMLKVILQNRGAKVITALSAADALKAMEHSRPDVLISDIAMPDQDGYELIEKIRQGGPERGGDIPAAALTAYARVEDRIHALTAGFLMYVQKPVDPDELVAVVANLTRLRH
jgi:PAS domain S-box-containing protein